jgi:type IV pilus assembly protein PilA
MKKAFMGMLLGRRGLYPELGSPSLARLFFGWPRLWSSSDVGGHMEAEPKKSGRMGVPALVLACMGIGLFVLLCARVGLDFLARPLGVRVTSKKSEARANLRALYTTQQAFRKEKDRYGQRFHELGFFPESGNRFAYFLMPTGPIELRESSQVKQNDEAGIIWIDRRRFKSAPKPTHFVGTGCPVTPGKDAAGNPVGLGVSGTYPNDAFIAVAAGDFDGDAELDCWSIASMPRVDSSGNPILAGVPYHEQDDTPPTKWERIRSALLGPFFYPGG